MAWIRWRGRTDRQWAYIGYKDPATGKEKYLAAETSDPARAEAERIRVERAIEGRLERPKRATAADLVDDWIEDLERRGVVECTRSGYAAKMSRVLGAIRERPLHTWTLGLLEDAILREGVSAQTIRGEFTVLGTFLSWCDARRYSVPRGLREQLRLTKKPSVRQVEREMLSPEHVAALLEHARGTWIEPPIALAALAGFGIGDVRALLWKEVRGLDGPTPEICRKQGRQKSGERLWVPLAPELAEVLKKHKHSGSHVCRLKGVRASLTGLDKVTAAAGVPRAKGDGWHRLRHTFGTRLSALGYDVETIRALLGHARASTVTLRYLHPVTSRMREAVGKVAG